MAIIPMADLRGYMEPSQIQMLLESCNSQLSCVMIRTLAMTGMRVSELISLKTFDIVWDERIIIVQTLKKRGEEQRRVPIDAKTLEMLRDYINRRNIKDVIFPYSRQFVFNIVRRVGKVAGITTIGTKKIHPHHFRHSFAVNWIKKGGDLRKLQMILGHSSISTTAVYLQFSPAENRDEYDKIMGDAE